MAGAVRGVAVATVVVRERVEGPVKVELKGGASWAVATVEGCRWPL